MPVVKVMGFRVMSFTGGSPLRILLAEADPSNQKVLLMILKRLGYAADAVGDGISVLHALEQKQYDILLVNIMMPEMDGFTVAQEIRKRGPALGLPKIIAVTTYVFPDSRKRCIDAGMDDFIAKPVRVDDLARMLAKYQGKDLSQKSKSKI